MQQAIVDLGKQEVLTVAHFQQAFPDQTITTGGNELVATNFKENSIVEITEFQLSLEVNNFQLKTAGIIPYSEKTIAGIGLGSKFETVFQNKELECIYRYFEAGSRTCYLPDNWQFATGFDGRKAAKIATGLVTIAKAKKMSRRKKVSWINWERVRSPI